MSVPSVDDPLPLNVILLPEDGEIVEVGKYRHRVQWTERNGGGLSVLTYCNWCGCPFLAEATMHELDGQIVNRDFHICPSCESFQGWADEYDDKPVLH